MLFRLHTVDVEMGPIESGCRLMLVYDFFAAKNPVQFPSVETTQNNLQLFRETLIDFRNHPEASGETPGLFAHILRRTTDRLRPDLDALDAHDCDFISALMSICNKKDGLLLYLANIEMEVSKNGLSQLGFDSDLGTEVETIIADSIRLNEIYDTDGIQLARGIKIGEENLLSFPPTVFQAWMNDTGDNEEKNIRYRGVVSGVQSLVQI